MKRIVQENSKLSKDRVAAAVKRPVTVKDKDGNDKVEHVDVAASEVLSWAEYPDADELVVVTVDGQRFTGNLPAAKK